MTNAELIQAIKAEIERRMDKHWEGLPNADSPEDDWTHNELCELGAYKELEHLESFLSTIESERPEPYNPIYDEAYLNEKIKKATESWKGVDVDAMLAECRGYDEEKSEKPMQEGLEEEIDRFEDWMETYNQADYPTSFTTRDIARYFARWGAEHAKEKSENPVTADLEEAAWKYAPDMPSYNIGGGYLPPQSREDLRTAFKDGAKWQKEQMLKEAMAGTVTSHNLNRYILVSGLDESLTYGDKVRVIVCKKED